MLRRPAIQSGLQTFLIGTIAAVLAYGVGVVLHGLFGVTSASAG